MVTDIVGYTGCFLLFISFIPQTYNTIKYEKYNDISIVFLLLIIKTSIIMTTYGALINKPPVMIANLSVFFNNIILLYFKKRTIN